MPIVFSCGPFLNILENPPKPILLVEARRLDMTTGRERHWRATTLSGI